MEFDLVDNRPPFSRHEKAAFASLQPIILHPCDSIQATVPQVEVGVLEALLGYLGSLLSKNSEIVLPYHFARLRIDFDNLGLSPNVGKNESVSPLKFVQH